MGKKIRWLYRGYTWQRYVDRVTDKQTSKPAQARFWSENSCKAPLLVREAVPGAFSGLNGFACLFISNSACRGYREYSGDPMQSLRTQSFAQSLVQSLCT